MKYKVFTAIFLIICLFPLVGILIFGTAQSAANESLASLPSVKNADGSFNVDILSDISDYLGDRFALRQEMVTLEHSLCAALFHQSGEESVILGKDGWLFYAETLDDYEGVNLMDEREIWAAARSLALIDEYCQLQGAEFRFTIAPNKNSLYGEYMPKRYPQSGARGNAERLAAALEEQGVGYTDLFAVFEAEDEILYRALDSHWNTRGAALAGDALLEDLGVDYEPFYTEDYEEIHEETGDLYEMVYPAGKKLDADWRCGREFTFGYANRIRSAEDNIIRTSNEGKTGSLLMFRDSFGNTLHSFMAEGFGSACFSRITPYDLTMIQSENADTAVIELVERNLKKLNTIPAIFPAPKREIDADVAQGDFSVVIAAEESENLAGYTRLSGSIEFEKMDDNSKIFIKIGESVYEATPAGEGKNPFCAYVPTDDLTDFVTIICCSEGREVSSGETAIQS